MKYYKTLNQYKCSNLVYDAINEIGFSYGWYVIAKRINGIMYLNNYGYSPSTLRHYYKLRNLFDRLKIEYQIITARQGLDDPLEAIKYHECAIEVLRQQIAKPRSKEYKNVERLNDIKKHLEQIATLQTF